MRHIKINLPHIVNLYKVVLKVLVLKRYHLSLCKKPCPFKYKIKFCIWLIQGSVLSKLIVIQLNLQCTILVIASRLTLCYFFTCYFKGCSELVYTVVNRLLALLWFKQFIYYVIRTFIVDRLAGQTTLTALSHFYPFY